MRTEICTKCFRPKHETATIGGMPIVSCVDFPEEPYPGGLILRDGIQWDCGCCKCDERGIAQIHNFPDVPMEEVKMLLASGRYSACKHFPHPQRDFDCPLCKAELELAKNSATVCVAVDTETGVITFDTQTETISGNLTSVR